MSEFVTLPAISLWQPHASLLFPMFPETIAQRFKVHETRSWPAPAKYIGHRIVIHAAKKKVRSADLSEPLRYLCTHQWNAAVDLLPYGAAIGTAVLTYCREMSEDACVSPSHLQDWICGDWTYGRFAWRLDDPIEFATPIPMIGRQRFFKAEIPAALLPQQKAA